jgi:hypothetical protein
MFVSVLYDQRVLTRLRGENKSDNLLTRGLV